MRRAVHHIVCVVAFVVASIFGGWCLGKLTSSISFEMPLWLASAIERGMYLARATDPLDPEAVEIFGLLLLWIAYSIITAVLLSMALLMLRRYLRRRRAS
jgi:hypothetical protein